MVVVCHGGWYRQITLRSVFHVEEVNLMLFTPPDKLYFMFAFYFVDLIYRRSNK